MVEQNKIALSDLLPSLKDGVWIILTVLAVTFFLTNMKEAQTVTNTNLVHTIAELQRTNTELAKTNDNLVKLADKVNDNAIEIGQQDIRLDNLEQRRFQSLAPTKENADQLAIRNSYENSYQFVPATKPEEAKKKEEEKQEKGGSETILGATGKALDESIKRLFP